MSVEKCSCCGEPFSELRGVYITVCDVCGVLGRYDDRDAERNTMAWAHMQAKDDSDHGNSHKWENGDEHKVNWRRIDD